MRAAAFPLLIFALNCYFTRDLFRLEYSQFMGSIEAAYISISRYMIANWSDLTWFPLWYGGIPFQNSYPPLLHAIVALTSAGFGTSPARAYHVVTALFYCLGPVALYALALRLTGSRWYSFWAAWFYSIISPSLFLMPSVRGDLGGWFGLRRYQALVPYGEGPHIASMALLPIALLGLDLAVVKRTGPRCVFAAAAMAAVVLSNWLGGFALAIAIFAYLMARSSGFGAWKMWAGTCGLGVLAYALACSWIPPSTIGDVLHNAQTVGGAFERVYQRLPLDVAAAIAAILALKFAMRRFRISEASQFFVFFALLMSAIPLGAEWFHTSIVPQPTRYHLEMDIALALAAVFALRPLSDRLSAVYRTSAASLLLVLSILPARLDRRYAWRLTKPVDIFQSVEYKTARWFDSHLDGGRVMADGTVSYWMNAFTDTPQLGGGFDQGIVNRANRAITYQILSGEGSGGRKGEYAELWLRAYGVEAIAVQGRESRQAYKPFLYPDVFAKSFPEAMRIGDDAVYWVPGRSPSLAHVVARESLVRDQPVNGLDVAQARIFVEALSNAAVLRWTSRHSAEIQAEVRRPRVISVQITYHPGWHATANGAASRVYGDGLGQIVIDPNCDGPCTVQLFYDGGREMQIARIVSWLSGIGCLSWIALSRRRR